MLIACTASFPSLFRRGHRNAHAQPTQTWNYSVVEASREALRRITGRDRPSGSSDITRDLRDTSPKSQDRHNGYGDGEYTELKTLRTYESDKGDVRYPAAVATASEV